MRKHKLQGRCVTFGYNRSPSCCWCCERCSLGFDVDEFDCAGTEIPDRGLCGAALLLLLALAVNTKKIYTPSNHIACYIYTYYHSVWLDSMAVRRSSVRVCTRDFSPMVVQSSPYAVKNRRGLYVTVAIHCSVCTCYYRLGLIPNWAVSRSLTKPIHKTI